VAVFGDQIGICEKCPFGCLDDFQCDSHQGEGIDAAVWDDVADKNGAVLRYCKDRIACSSTGTLLKPACPVELGEKGANGCSEFLTAIECQDYATKDSSLHWQFVGASSDYPKGCFWYPPTNGVYFNEHATGGGHSELRPVCKKCSNVDICTKCPFGCLDDVQCDSHKGECIDAAVWDNVANTNGAVLNSCKDRIACSSTGTLLKPGRRRIQEAKN